MSFGEKKMNVWYLSGKAIIDRFQTACEKFFKKVLQKLVDLNSKLY